MVLGPVSAGVKHIRSVPVSFLHHSVAMLAVVVTTLVAVLVAVHADTPANCSYPEVRGKWTFYESPRTFASSVDCSSVSHVARKVRVDLQYPDVVVDQFGNHGHWTMVYGQGFEVTVNGRSYFAFSDYEQDGSVVTSYCNRTRPGYSHDVTLRHWACFYGRKNEDVTPKVHQHPFPAHDDLLDTPLARAHHERLVRRVNSAQNTWRAEVHDPFVGLTRRDLLLLRGGPKSWIGHRPPPSPPTEYVLQKASELPDSFDWRDVNGQDYVSPVRNQAQCGSCYAFSAMGMLESRLRVQTNNTLQLVLSPQDIVSCSSLSQGCAGGFPYLVAGKYGMDFGTVEERCDPYTGRDDACVRETCDRHYTANYRYVGGYYGACNDQLMQIALYEGGPLSVSFEVYPDFMHYKGGVYHHTGVRDFNPFVEVNHAVLLVGWGVEPSTGEKYWTIRNSWGKDWGENGYFRIRRGSNEVGVESIAVEATPIP